MFVWVFVTYRNVRFSVCDNVGKGSGTIFLDRRGRLDYVSGMHSDTQIQKILNKLETATNLARGGALDDAELDALRGYVRAAEHLRVLAEESARHLNTAVNYIGSYR